MCVQNAFFQLEASFPAKNLAALQATLRFYLATVEKKSGCEIKSESGQGTGLLKVYMVLEKHSEFQTYNFQDHKFNSKMAFRLKLSQWAKIKLGVEGGMVDPPPPTPQHTHTFTHHCSTSMNLVMCTSTAKNYHSSAYLRSWKSLRHPSLANRLARRSGDKAWLEGRFT